MKRITKESLSIVFQITVIIFLFTYSTSPVKVAGKAGSFQPVVKDALPAKKQTEQVPATNSIIDYAIKTNPALLYTHLIMVANFKSTSATNDVKERTVTKASPGSNIIQPAFLSSTKF
jgi:hypothetical protein